MSFSQPLFLLTRHGQTRPIGIFTFEGLQSTLKDGLITDGLLFLIQINSVNFSSRLDGGYEFNYDNTPESLNEVMSNVRKMMNKPQKSNKVECPSCEQEYPKFHLKQWGGICGSCYDKTRR